MFKDENVKSVSGEIILKNNDIEDYTKPIPYLFDNSILFNINNSIDESALEDFQNNYNISYLFDNRLLGEINKALKTYEQQYMILSNE